ncbi:MAG: LD-carboxypeptidase [Emergencia sp.]
MRYPEKIKKGETVGIICPSSDIETARIAQCISAVEKLGYKVKAADNLDTCYAGYMAGTGEVRGQWINRMFADPEVKGIFCIRGGDGGSRVMEYLDYDVIRSNPKVFVGYSDVTCLHLAINQNCDLVTFHGPMVSSNMVDSFDAETAKSFFAAIEAEKDFTFANPEGFEIGVLKEGAAEGILTGGNLSLLSASIGTPYEIDTKDRILFIEEVCEPITKVEKWAYHLRNAGKLKQCRGILLGQFTKIENEDEPAYDAVRCMTDVLEGLDVPVMYNIQSGHGKPMMTLPMGAVCRMDTASGTISFKVDK